VKAPANVPREAIHTGNGSANKGSGNGGQAANEFAKGISHELRTPLNVIIGMCQFLERDRQTPLSPVHRDAVDRMDRNARALLQSVNHLLEFLRDGRLKGV